MLTNHIRCLKHDTRIASFSYFEINANFNPKLYWSKVENEATVDAFFGARFCFV